MGRITIPVPLVRKRLGIARIYLILPVSVLVTTPL